jgi:hypothetical protein
MVRANIQPILLITGLITALAAIAFVTPRPLLRILFSVERWDPITLFVARHWGLLVGMIGILLVSAAYEPSLRTAAIALAAVEKIAIVGLIVFVPPRRTTAMWVIVAGDGAMAAAYLLYFAGL